MTTEDVQTIEEATGWVGNETTMIVVTTIDSEINIALIGAVIGGISGSLLVLLVFFLLLAVMWVIKKRRRCVNETKYFSHLHHQAQIEGNKQVSRVHVELEGEGDQSMKVNGNCAYNTLDSLIPTVNNVAYNIISDKHEYDYIYF